MAGQDEKVVVGESAVDLRVEELREGKSIPLFVRFQKFNRRRGIHLHANEAGGGLRREGERTESGERRARGREGRGLSQTEISRKKSQLKKNANIFYTR